MSGVHEAKQHKEWTCPHCARVYDNGWQRIRHTQRGCDIALQQYVVKEEGNNAEVTRTQTSLGALGGNTNGVPLYNRQPMDDDDIAFANTMTGSDDVFLGQGEARAELHPVIVNEVKGGQMQQYTQAKARSFQILPKDMEILHFLECTDAGNGTSQAQKNTLLQYIKGFDTPRTRLLPSWIPTCYRRMEKVMSTYVPPHMCVTSLLSFTIHTPMCALFEIMYINIEINYIILK
jgi:hypothetical protein